MKSAENMKQVYADMALKISKREFDTLSKPLKVEFDCDKYDIKKDLHKNDDDDF